jgi:hypothetical protein
MTVDLPVWLTFLLDGFRQMPFAEQIKTGSALFVGFFAACTFIMHFSQTKRGRRLLGGWGPGYGVTPGVRVMYWVCGLLVLASILKGLGFHLHLE